MKINNILSFYFLKSLLNSFVFCTLVSASFIFLIDSIELSRRIAKSSESDIMLSLKLAFLKLPGMIFEILPFIVLFASLSTFFVLARRSELIIARASGISIWRLLLPGICLIMIIGFFTVIVLQPLIATSSYKFKELEARFIRGQPSLVTLSENGLWLKDINQKDRSYRIINSLGLEKQASNLEKVIFFNHSESGKLISRFDAESALLTNNSWELDNIWVYESEKKPDFKNKIILKTNLTPNQIQENFAPPETISVWNLPKFIKIAEQAGFTATKHKTKFYSILIFPLFLASMLIIAAPFSVRFIRSEKTNTLILSGLLCGLLLYTLSNVVLAFGASGSISPILSAWSPPVLAILLGISALIFIEEG